MSQPAAPSPPEHRYSPQSAKPRPKPFLGIIALGIVGAAIALVFVVGNGTQVSGKPVASTSTAATSTKEEAEGVDAPVAGYVPAPTDFALEMVVLREACFGSAGCNVTFTIKVNYLAVRLPDASKTFTVIYDVTGATQPFTDSFTINGTQVSMRSEQFIQTDSPNAALVATVTQTL